jgi:hypothetical protein
LIPPIIGNLGQRPRLNIKELNGNVVKGGINPPDKPAKKSGG